MKQFFSFFALLSLLAACAQSPAPQQGEAPAQSGEVYRARIHTELAAQYYARRQYSIALQELREALRSDPSYAPAYNMQALVHVELREDREAEEFFRRAIELAPQYAEAHNNYGYFLCQHKRYEAALAEFEQAWKNLLYATPEKALANAGQCMLSKGDAGAAEDYARRALVRAPDQPAALLALAEVRLQQGDAQAARQSLRQLEKASQLDAAALWLGVRIERLLGNRMAEGDYGARLRRHYPDAVQTRWLLNGQYHNWGGGRD